jgi:hypothetical protein
LFTKSFMVLINASRIEGRNNVNSARTVKSLKSSAKLVCSRLQLITFQSVKREPGTNSQSFLSPLLKQIGRSSLFVSNVRTWGQI